MTTQAITKVIHRSETRGFANHGWLKSYHTFSFANYHNEERIHFGVLRVLNDDVVQGGRGFGAHPHDNMEIISIPLSGALEHQDSTGRHKVIKTNDVQIMSGGTGIVHSEFNHSKTEEVNFLQIWIFPKKQNIPPRYEQKTFDPANRQNKFQVVVAPDEQDGSIWINQDAYLSLANIDAGQELIYTSKKEGNGIYVFVLEGELEIAGEILNKRDAIGLSTISTAEFKARQHAEVLVLDVPMALN